MSHLFKKSLNILHIYIYLIKTSLTWSIDPLILLRTSNRIYWLVNRITKGYVSRAPSFPFNWFSIGRNRRSMKEKRKFRLKKKGNKIKREQRNKKGAARVVTYRSSVSTKFVPLLGVKEPAIPRISCAEVEVEVMVLAAGQIDGLRSLQGDPSRILPLLSHVSLIFLILTPAA